MSRLTAKLSRLPAHVLDDLLRPKRPKMRKALKRVIFDGLIYEDAGKECGVTKQAIYDQLKSMECHMEKINENRN